jgi:ssDNA-binding Zn-finger/Zn-ribbon topoisomerase 1
MGAWVHIRMGATGKEVCSKLGGKGGEEAMKATREQKRVRLLAAAEAAIDELLAWEETNKAPNLRQIEEEVLKLREEFGQELALTVLEGQEVVQPVAEVRCPKCGQEMRYKGQKPTGIESWVVNGALKRGYYYCPACKQGIFPPG